MKEGNRKAKNKRL